MTKTSQPPATQKEHHLWNRKKSYFSEVCLWDTSLLTMISDSFKTTSWKIYRTSKILSNIFPHLLVKTEGRDGESATQRKQTWNYLFWLELCVLLANMEKGNSKHYLYADKICLSFLTMVSAFLYHFMSWNFTGKLFDINLWVVLKVFTIPTWMLAQIKLLRYCLWPWWKSINIK